MGIFELLEDYLVDVPIEIGTLSPRVKDQDDSLKIDVPGNDDLEARGNLFQHEYGIFRGTREVGHISKAWIVIDGFFSFCGSRRRLHARPTSLTFSL